MKTLGQPRDDVVSAAQVWDGRFSTRGTISPETFATTLPRAPGQERDLDVRLDGFLARGLPCAPTPIP